MMASDNDYLDGIKFRTSTDQSNNVDIAHYTTLRLGINVGRFDRRTEPLYWLNPMENIYNSIANLNIRPQFEWEDNDNDGVLDILDQELNTPAGCIVDTKGVTLDSDGDTVVDCLDREPFSPPGYPVDEFGVAQVDGEDLVILTEQDVITIIENNCDACINQIIGYLPHGDPLINIPDRRVLSEDEINPELYGSTSVRFRSKDPDIGFGYNIGNTDNQSPDWEIKIPSDMDIVATWETYEGPTYDSTEFARSDSTEFRFEFMKRQEFVIVH